MLPRLVLTDEYTAIIVLFLCTIFLWYDWAIAAAWFAAVFVLCFRSKLYWNLGKLPGYPLTDQSAFGPFKH